MQASSAIAPTQAGLCLQEGPLSSRECASNLHQPLSEVGSWRRVAMARAILKSSTFLLVRGCPASSVSVPYAALNYSIVKSIN